MAAKTCLLEGPCPYEQNGNCTYEDECEYQYADYANEEIIAKKQD